MRSLPIPTTQTQVDFTTLMVNPNGAFLYASEPWRIALGEVPNTFVVNKFGRNPDIDTATVPEDIWGGGGVDVAIPEKSDIAIRITACSANNVELIFKYDLLLQANA